ncbi:MAG TPA: hypothetical protein VGP90_14500, partial [Acidimicrobiia bacterium]|nr:hypothetical protein [Acidimicrobiia bacterium]
MLTFSRRVFGVASALTLTAVLLAPSASAALLGSGSGGSGGGLTDSLPLSGDLLTPVSDLLGGGNGGLLGGGLLGG